MKNLLLYVKYAGGLSAAKKYLLPAGCLLMGISFFLPWVKLGDVFSGYDLAILYSGDNQAHLRFLTVPKAAAGLLIFFIANAPRNIIYYTAPVFSLIPLAAVDGIILEYQAVYFGFYLLHAGVILIWIGAFTYKQRPLSLMKSFSKIWGD